MVAYLTGPDEGPISQSFVSNWKKKIISSSTNKLKIEFKSDDIWEQKGFSANIFFTNFTNKECKSWLDINKKILKSPNYPQTYHNSTKCHWLITVDLDSHITLNIIELYVRISNYYAFTYLLFLGQNNQEIGVED